MEEKRKNRVFAILNWKKDRRENVENEILKNLPALSEDDRVVVFYRKSDYSEPPAYNVPQEGVSIEAVPVSEEDGRNRAAGVNFVVKSVRDRFLGKGYVAYCMYDSIQILNPKFCDFLPELEVMMSNLGLDVWFNTYTDVCNFVFDKFDGRIAIAINEPKYKAIYDKTIIFTSHSNPYFMAVDLDKFEIAEDGRMFDDRFDVPMFWIIKFLCERAACGKGFMNHYPTISEEIGAYRLGKFEGSKFSMERMRVEDRMFSEMHLNHEPNQSVEALMDFIVSRLDLRQSGV